MSDIEKYVIVSQGIIISEFDVSQKQEAINFIKSANKDWLEYKQKCMDSNKDYVDNECFLYGEKDDGDIELIEV